MKVFVVEHVTEDYYEFRRVVAVYATREAAEADIDRLRKQHNMKYDEVDITEWDVVGTPLSSDLYEI